MEEKQEYEYKLALKALEKQRNPGFQKISCPRCGESVPADHINIQDKIAKCGGCHAVFPFKLKMEELLNARKPKQTVLRPEGIDLYAYQNELEIAVGQEMSALDVLPWTVWPIFPILFTIMFFQEGFPLAIMLGSWMLGVFPIFNLINFSKHKVYMTIDDVYFKIQRRPKKLVKDKQFLIRDIDQVYLKDYHGAYRVMMMVNQPTGQKAVVLMMVSSITKARFLEQEIEKYLKIEDREVEGEVK